MAFLKEKNAEWPIFMLQTCVLVTGFIEAVTELVTEFGVPRPSKPFHIIPTNSK